jgi:PIN domain nuclease of toxin-antitoxin system
VTFLLDTHVWLWMLGAPERIRPELRDELDESGTRLLLSAVSSWEIAIKYSIGRLPLPEPPPSYVPSRMQRSGVHGLAIEHIHALHVATLDRHHRDPFDRLLIAQAQIADIPLVTADPVFEAYDVEVVRASA